tara:strand:+ start:33198 stop:34322 length:1125 start_codon:yes stop_codon:yes gene_type:complete
MSKISPSVTTAFAIVHTEKRIEQLEDRWSSIINEVETIRGLQGFDGEKGDRGERGPQGARGFQGETGTTGADGTSGSNGTDGADGARGEAGETGEPGFQGIQGLKGDTGDIGPVGETGSQGERGLAGDTGKTGAKGDTGKTGERGETGATGSVGPKGDLGSQGDQGVKGAKGVKGDTGDTGLRGETGERGEIGPQGIQGDAGTPAPDYKEKFEDALEKFNSRLTENAAKVEGSLQQQIEKINRSLSTIGGGGSYKIVDNADVDKAAITSLVDDAVLIYDPTKKKFVAQSFLSILDRLKADLEVQYDKLVDEEPDDGFTYVGEAVPGTTKGQSIWRIKRIYEFGADGDLDILWANGTADFDKTWNDRATYTYSAD